jgi:hypothetical protein
MKILKRASVILACGALAACQDLTVLDKSRPSLDASLATGTNLETSVQSAARYFWGGVVMGNSLNQCLSGLNCAATFVPVIENYNDNMTFGGGSTSVAVQATQVMFESPRAEFDHVSDLFVVNKAPFADAYSAIATCHDVRAAIAGGMQGAAFPQYQRANYFCLLVMGLGHLYMGLLYDKAYVVPDDKVRPIDVAKYQVWVPHDSVIEFAKTMIHNGINEAKEAPVTSTVVTWLNGVQYTNVDMAKIAYGYLARAEVYKAATPAQREDISRGGVVDWNKVITYVDSSLQSTWTIGTAPSTFQVNNAGGMNGPNFTIKATNNQTQTRNGLLYMLMVTTSNNFYRIHHKALGPGDTTGGYVSWLKTPIGERNDTVYASPDRRLPRGPCLVGATSCPRRHVTTAGANATTSELVPEDGKYFQYLSSQFSLTFNGDPNNPWRRASVQFIRFGSTAIARRTTNTGTGVAFVDFQTIMTPEEQDLLKAEAYMRLGQPALAVPLINRTRQNINKGALPAVSVTGPTQPYPQCVPHSFFNAEKCGDLWDALLWEKRMEQMGTDAFLNWSDWRSFGLLDPGTPVYFPPSYRETGQLGLPYYTYGGRTPGSAGTPSWAVQPCPTSTAWQYIGCTDYTTADRLPKPPQ